MWPRRRALRVSWRTPTSCATAFARTTTATPTVIHPFVDEAFLEPPLNRHRDDFHVIVSALVPYKHIELAIDAAADAGSS